MVRSFLTVAVGVFALSSTAFAQSTHNINIDIETTTAVDASGSPSLTIRAPISAGMPYEASDPDNTSTISYTSNGGTIQADIDISGSDGFDIEMTVYATTCGTGATAQILNPSVTAVDLTGAGGCSDFATVEYRAIVTDSSQLMPGTMYNRTVTFTMF